MKGGSDLGARVLAAVPAIAFAGFLVAQGGEVFSLGLALLGLICLHELYAMFDRAHPARLAGFVGYLGMIAAATYGEQFHILLALAAAVPLTFLVAANMPAGGGAPSIAVTLMGLVWIGVAFSHAVLLRDLDHGGGIIVAILLGTFIGDTGAYLGGRALGQTPLAPRISPNKTLEGLAVGIAFAFLAVWWYGLSTEWMGGTKGAVLGISIALAGPVGDLFESYLKRDAGTKDTGRVFGAHGGALDRLDAVLFTAVTGYFVWVGLV
ncbi:MAG TPA: phosphatidate cytidylyltransferase [Baekduia sp.]|nr:phosphatidate cytidylyltransferase [Baekduia sp.]